MGRQQAEIDGFGGDPLLQSFGDGRAPVNRQTFRVTFQPDGRNVFVLDGTNLVEAAGQAGIVLNQPCGGQGTCGKCRVQITENTPPPGPAARNLLSEEELEDGVRLSCQIAVDRDMKVWVPDESRFFEQVILTEGAGEGYTFNPPVRKQCVSVSGPTVEDQRSYVDRLMEALSDGPHELEMDLGLIRSLPRLAGEEDYTATAVMKDGRIHWIEKGDTTDSAAGVAVDIGTTTVVATLVDLVTGKSEAVASRTNPQVSLGDDVVSRIKYAGDHSDGLKKLTKRIVTCVNELVEELLAQSDFEERHIYEIVMVGNTTMNHLLLGLDPGSLGRSPYVAVLRGAADVRAEDLGLELKPYATAHVLPNIAGFVGADTVGVILASGMHRSEEVNLAIDIGTNGEVVVGNKNRMVACSCAAGPAFEGARIRHGMRAAEGAISKVVINDEGIEVSVIGGGRASGICGSGLIDAVAELLRAGVISPQGRMSASEDTPAEVADCVTDVDGEPAVILVDEHRSKTGHPILLTQKDVRELQLGKAAIRAGVEVALQHYGVESGELSGVLLAGGLGNFIRRSNALRMGLLPDVPGDRIECIGNAASAGARMALVSRTCRERAERVSRETEYLELAGSADFQKLFAEYMMFPDATPAESAD